MKVISGMVVVALMVFGTAPTGAAKDRTENVPATGFAATLEHVDELINIEKLEEAVGALKGLRARTPNDAAKISFRLGKIFLQLDRPAKALEHFEDAVFSTMDDGEIYVGLAQANLALGNLSRARIHAQTALRFDTGKDLAAVHVVLATIDDRSGRPESAKKRFADLHRNNPDSETVVTAYARFLAHRGNSDSAVALLTPFVDLFPHRAEASDLLGLLHWARGRRQEAYKYRSLAARAFEFLGNKYRARQIAAWIEKNNLARDEKPPPVAPKIDSKPEPEPPSVSPPIQAQVLRRPDPLPFGAGKPVLTGSGFIVGGGKFVITNRHVIDKMGKVAVRNGTGEVRMARVRTVAKDDDLAILELLKAYPENYAIPFESFEDPRPGKSAVVMGFPMTATFGWQRPSLTEGVVSKDSGLKDNPSTFLMTSKMNKGNSGGPIFDRTGNLIGVAVAKLDTTGVYQKKGHLPEDVNIGIKASRVLNFLKNGTGARREGSPISLEDLYHNMLAKVVLVVGEER